MLDHIHPSLPQSFFRKKHVELIKQAPYSPDLNQCDKWLFKFLKGSLRTTSFASEEEVLQAVSDIMRNLSREKLSHEFDNASARQLR